MQITFEPKKLSQTIPIYVQHDLMSGAISTIFIKNHPTNIFIIFILNNLLSSLLTTNVQLMRLTETTFKFPFSVV